MKIKALLAMFFVIASFSEAPSAIWEQVNREGFDPTFYWWGIYNYGVFDDSLAVFNGKLYAGTDNPDNGPEVWAFGDSGIDSWEKVSDDPVNLGKSIFYGGESTLFLIEFNGYLYGGTAYGTNADVKKNGQVWRTADGLEWEKVFDYDDWINAQDKIGSLFSAVVFQGNLYLSAGLGVHAEIFRSSDGISWDRIVDQNSPGGFNDLNVLSAHPFEIFNGELYVGLTNKNNGGEIWKSADGENWTQSNTDGMTADAYQKDRFMIRQLIVFNSAIYATVINSDYTNNTWRWIEVWKSENGTDWAQIGGNGFGDPSNNVDGRGVAIYNNCLHIGTGGYTVDEQQPRIYQTCDGETFSEITDGLGDSYNHGIMDLTVFENCLYAATYRYHTVGIGGTEVWRLCDEDLIDSDGDGIPDYLDNCPNKPNGPLLGTCYSTSDKPGINCTTDSDCANGCSSNGLCIKDQRDTDNDGIGDVCDETPITTTTSILPTTTTSVNTTTSVALTTSTTTSSITNPTAPSNLTANAVSSRQINLTWEDNATNETGLKIERATSASGPFNEIATSGANVTSYQNIGLNRKTTYYYRVRAYNATGNSGYSNTASATTLKK